jgi:hypothetical protein
VATLIVQGAWSHCETVGSFVRARIDNPGPFGSQACSGIEGLLTVLGEVFEAFDFLSA